jgi:hypothetical protein
MSLKKTQIKDHKHFSSALAAKLTSNELTSVLNFEQSPVALITSPRKQQRQRSTPAPPLDWHNNNKA